LKLKRLEKVFYKSFAKDTCFPTFSFPSVSGANDSHFGAKRAKLTLYGEENHDELFATTTQALKGR
jgi:hypothetical protein